MFIAAQLFFTSAAGLLFIAAQVFFTSAAGLLFIAAQLFFTSAAGTLVYVYDSFLPQLGCRCRALPRGHPPPPGLYLQLTEFPPR